MNVADMVPFDPAEATTDQLFREAFYGDDPEDNLVALSDVFWTLYENESEEFEYHDLTEEQQAYRRGRLDALELAAVLSIHGHRVRTCGNGQKPGPLFDANGTEQNDINENDEGGNE